MLRRKKVCRENKTRNLQNHDYTGRGYKEGGVLLRIIRLLPLPAHAQLKRGETHTPYTYCISRFFFLRALLIETLVHLTQIASKGRLSHTHEREKANPT